LYKQEDCRLPNRVSIVNQKTSRQPEPPAGSPQRI
jgi:hypothetical protein